MGEGIGFSYFYEKTLPVKASGRNVSENQKGAWAIRRRLQSAGALP